MHVYTYSLKSHLWYKGKSKWIPIDVFLKHAFITFNSDLSNLSQIAMYSAMVLGRRYKYYHMGFIMIFKYKPLDAILSIYINCCIHICNTVT